MNITYKLFKNNQPYNERVLYDFETYLLELEQISDEVTEYIQSNYSSVLTSIHQNFYQLQFKNRVGWVNIFGDTYRLLSYKWEESRVHQLWLSISERLSALPFHHFAESKQSADTSYRDKQQIQYHQWVFFRDQFLYQDGMWQAWESIEREPHTQVVIDKRGNDPWLATHLNENSFMDMIIYGHMTNLSNQHPLAQTVVSQQMNERFPTRVDEVIKRIHFDTRENQWIKWLLTELLELTDWMDKYIQQAHRSRSIYRIDHLKEENQLLKLYLKQMMAVPWIAEVGRFQGTIGNSTILQRKQGYRQWFGFYQRYIQGTCYPLETSQLKELVESKKISDLFEYWCFFEILDAIESSLELNKHSIRFVTSDFSGMILQEGTRVDYQLKHSTLSVYYNKTFSKGRESYSTELRPDISIHWDGKWVHIDAKFKNTLESDFLKEDIYKMHVYRDAIHNSQAAVAIYPVIDGCSTKTFFSSNPDYAKNGVGAISLDVIKENIVLREWIREVLLS